MPADDSALATEHHHANGTANGRNGAAGRASTGKPHAKRQRGGDDGGSEAATMPTPIPEPAAAHSLTRALERALVATDLSDARDPQVQLWLDAVPAAVDWVMATAEAANAAAAAATSGASTPVHAPAVLGSSGAPGGGGGFGFPASPAGSTVSMRVAAFPSSPSMARGQQQSAAARVRTVDVSSSLIPLAAAMGSVPWGRIGRGKRFDAISAAFEAACERLLCLATFGGGGQVVPASAPASPMLQQHAAVVAMPVVEAALRMLTPDEPATTFVALSACGLISDAEVNSRAAEARAATTASEAAAGAASLDSSPATAVELADAAGDVFGQRAGGAADVERVARIINTAAAAHPAKVVDLLRHTVAAHFPPPRWPVLSHFEAWVDLLFMLAALPGPPKGFRCGRSMAGGGGASSSVGPLSPEGAGRPTDAGGWAGAGSSGAMTALPPPLAASTAEQLPAFEEPAASTTNGAVAASRGAKRGGRSGGASATASPGGKPTTPSAAGGNLPSLRSYPVAEHRALLLDLVLSKLLGMDTALLTSAATDRGAIARLRRLVGRSAAIIRRRWLNGLADSSDESVLNALFAFHQHSVMVVDDLKGVHMLVPLVVSACDPHLIAGFLHACVSHAEKLPAFNVAGKATAVAHIAPLLALLGGAFAASGGGGSSAAGVAADATLSGIVRRVAKLAHKAYRNAKAAGNDRFADGLFATLTALSERFGCPVGGRGDLPDEAVTELRGRAKHASVKVVRDAARRVAAMYDAASPLTGPFFGGKVANQLRRFASATISVQFE